MTRFSLALARNPAPLVLAVVFAVCLVSQAQDEGRREGNW